MRRYDSVAMGPRRRGADRSRQRFGRTKHGARPDQLFKDGAAGIRPPQNDKALNDGIYPIGSVANLVD